MVRDYKRLNIWVDAYQLTLDLYKITKAFPNYEKYRLTDQLLRAVSSIPANIVEGCGQNSTVATRRFLFIAYGSIKETEHHLLLAKDLGYIDEKAHEQISDRIDKLGRMMYNFITNMPVKKEYLKLNREKTIDKNTYRIPPAGSRTPESL